MREAVSTHDDAAAPGTIKVALAVAAGALLNPLSGTMIVVSLSDIGAGFGRSIGEATWLLTLFLAVTAALQPIAGAAGDRFGRRRVYALGLSFFVLANIAAALAPSFTALVAARCVQAAASAVVLPNGQALLRDAVPPDKRGLALGVLGAVMGGAASLGLPLGAWLASTSGWRTIFWVNVPFGLVGLVAALRVFRPTVRKPTRPSSLALVGAVLLPLAIGGELAKRSRDLGQALGYGAAAAVVALVLVGLVARSPRARADLGRVGGGPFASSAALIMLNNLAFYTTLLVLPSWLVATLALPRPRVGLYLGGLTLAMMVVVPAAGRASDRLSPRALVSVGNVLMGGGLLWTATHGGQAGATIAGLVVTGIGFGVLAPTVQRTALQFAPEDGLGQAMGLFMASRYAGGIMGALLLAASLPAGGDIDAAGGTKVIVRVVLAAMIPAVLVALTLPKHASAKAS